jgi:hypothetical protein
MVLLVTRSRVATDTSVFVGDIGYRRQLLILPPVVKGTLESPIIVPRSQLLLAEFQTLVWIFQRVLLPWMDCRGLRIPASVRNLASRADMYV